jgi:Holliday junction resolvasome RuvABC endonuclease subunit
MFYADFISIDPSSHTGIALWNGNKLIDAFEFNYNFDEFLKFFKYIQGIKRLAIETQYYHTNAKVLMRLVEIRTEITTMLRLLNPGMEVIDVKPSEWQTILGGGGEVKRRERKKTSKLFASALINRQVKSDNVSDAICLGWYVLTKGGNI